MSCARSTATWSLLLQHAGHALPSPYHQRSHGWICNLLGHRPRAVLECGVAARSRRVHWLGCQALVPSSAARRSLRPQRDAGRCWAWLCQRWQCVRWACAGQTASHHVLALAAVRAIEVRDDAGTRGAAGAAEIGSASCAPFAQSATRGTTVRTAAKTPGAAQGKSGSTQVMASPPEAVANCRVCSKGRAVLAS